MILGFWQERESVDEVREGSGSPLKRERGRPRRKRLYAGIPPGRHLSVHIVNFLFFISFLDFSTWWHVTPTCLSLICLFWLFLKSVLFGPTYLQFVPFSKTPFAVILGFHFFIRKEKSNCCFDYSIQASPEFFGPSGSKELDLFLLSHIF